MKKLPVLSGKDVVKVLSKIGFVPKRQKGSHIILIKFVEGKKTSRDYKAGRSQERRIPRSFKKALMYQNI